MSARTLLRTGLNVPRCAVFPRHITSSLLLTPRLITTQALPQPTQPRSFFRRPGLLLGLLAVPLFATPLYLDSDDPSNEHPPTLTTLTNRDLVRAYVVYTMCSFPTIVDLGPKIIDWCYATRIPGVKWIMEKIVRVTFFEQFAGSDTIEGSAPIVERLAARGVGTLFAYSVEADQNSVVELSSDDAKGTGSTAASSTSLNQDLVSANLRSVEFASHMNVASGADTAVAMKVSGMLKDPAVLIRVSSAVLPRNMFTSNSHTALTKAGLLEQVQSSLSPSDRDALNELVEVFREAGRLAQPGNVKVIIDAEQSWLQPAIDVIFLAVARELRNPLTTTASWSQSFSNLTHEKASLPTFYMTLQTSLKRSQPLLQALLDDAQTHSYPLGVKLVRGAYVDQEHKAAASIDVPTAAWESKQETDVCYNTCATILVDGVASSVAESNKYPSLGAMFASHNRHSVALVVELMKTKGLVRTAAGPGSDKSDETLVMNKGVSSRISFGQLYGMADDITDGLGRNLLTPDGSKAVYKYLPYGPLDRVIPYLVRRAKENKSVMAAGASGGGAYEEKKRIKGEVKRRVKGWWKGEEDVTRAAPVKV